MTLHMPRTTTPSRLRVGFALAALAAAACTGGSTTPFDEGPITGIWNGDHVSLALSSTGGEVEYDCAHGGLRTPLLPDLTGRFAAAGVHVREFGGPIDPEIIPDSIPAVYWGRRSGDVLTLRVAIGPDTIGPFTLRRAAPSRLLKCL